MAEEGAAAATESQVGRGDGAGRVRLLSVDRVALPRGGGAAAVLRRHLADGMLAASSIARKMERETRSPKPAAQRGSLTRGEAWTWIRSRMLGRDSLTHGREGIGLDHRIWQIERGEA